MNRYINNEIYDKIKKNVKVGQAPDPLLKNFEFDNKMASYYQIRNYVLNKTYRVRMLLIIAMKEITWRKELENKFDVHPSHITEFFEYMKENAMILYKPLVEVEDILFESVIKQNSNSFYGKRDTVKVYTLTPEGKEICKKLMDGICKLTNERTDLAMDLKYIMGKTENHRLLMKKIYDEEMLLPERTVKYPDGFVETKKTIRSKKIEEETAKAITNIRKTKLLGKKSQGVITSQESTELAKIESGAVVTTQVVNKIKGTSVTYNGKHSHKTQAEIETLMNEELTDKEFIKFKKEREKKFKEHMDAVREHGWCRGKGYHEEINYIEEVKQSSGDEGLDFLNSLK